MSKDQLAQLDVYFRGGPGDALKFSKDHNLPNEAKSDPVGAFAKTHGVTYCPALLLDGKVLGNGTPVDLRNDLIEALESGN
ncbi:MAG TPA: hypothetical protein PKA27_16440 [Fimbriimonadaceae bacterium]|nr:hypothetical protein [Fimbriimonadaceae bacterium]